MRHQTDPQLDQEARQRAVSLEAQGRLPAGFTAHHYPLTRLERLELSRLKISLRLATDLDGWRDLLLGLPVDPDRINKDALENALEASLVQLVRPIDVLHRRVA